MLFSSCKWAFSIMFALALFASFSFVGEKEILLGEWVLSEIHSDEYIEVAQNNIREREASASDAVAKTRIKVSDFLQKSMSVGISKFIFSATAFEFYRNGSLTNSGSWNLKEDELTLLYLNGEKRVKYTIISLTASRLELKIDVEGKDAILIFSQS